MWQKASWAAQGRLSGLYPSDDLRRSLSFVLCTLPHVSANWQMHYNLTDQAIASLTRHSGELQNKSISRICTTLQRQDSQLWTSSMPLVTETTLQASNAFAEGAGCCRYSSIFGQGCIAFAVLPASCSLPRSDCCSLSSHPVFRNDVSVSC